MQGECHMNLKAEIGVMHLPAKESQRLPADRQELEEQTATECPSTPGGASPADSAISDSSLQDGETTPFCCLSHSVCATLSRQP